METLKDLKRFSTVYAVLTGEVDPVIGRSYKAFSTRAEAEAYGRSVGQAEVIEMRITPAPRLAKGDEQHGT